MTKLLQKLGQGLLSQTLLQIVVSSLALLLTQDSHQVLGAADARLANGAQLEVDVLKRRILHGDVLD